MIALAKAEARRPQLRLTGVGNPLHLTMEMLKRAAGIDIQAIPYRGDAPLNAALIAGEIDVAIVPMATMLPLMQSAGSALAVTARSARRRCPTCRRWPRRTSRLRVVGWQGLFVPAKTPREIVMTIQRETAKAL